jgi:Na+/H+ antiporter NhaD/arsenite permease-like protein
VTAAGWSLAALLLAIVLSCTSRINVGLLALALAWGVGTFAARLKPDAVASGFPASLFLTLSGVTLLFALAEVNGTLEAIARRALGGIRDAHLLPLLVFGLAAGLAAVGPGAVAATALLAPVAMTIAGRARLPAFPMALMVATGTGAGNLSPLSAVGIIARDGMAKAGIVGQEWKTLLANFLAHLLVGAVAWALFRGQPASAASTPDGTPEDAPRFDKRQRLTLAVVGLWMAGALFAGLPVGFGAFAAATLLVLTGASDEGAALRRVPWGVIVMVTGMTTLIGVLEKTGGMDLFTVLLARLSTPDTVNGVVAFVTGLISTWSSTSGVVMPAFLPTAQSLVERLGGGDPLAVALSINVGSALVDVSPLSTIGALCVAAVSDPDTSGDLFRKLLLWGLSMTVVGALLCQLVAGPLARF